MVYNYTCKESTCNGAAYIGYITCTLPVRFYSHMEHGSIQKHNKDRHCAKLFIQELLESTKVMYRNQCTSDLKIAKALLIKQHNAECGHVLLPRIGP